MAPPDPPSGSASEGRLYAGYVVGVLFTVQAFNIVDRHVFALLIQPIKEELGVSDAWMGALAGLAFAVFYTVAGLPVARWADRGVRRSIIALGLFAWSLMTIACGLAQNLLQMVLARIGVGIGEAAGSPPAHSLISDSFPPQQRGAVLGITSMGGSAGLILAFLLGGWTAEHYGWRAAFAAAGAPGIALALLVRLTIREPPRGRFDGAAAPRAPATLRDALRFLLGLRAFRHLTLAGSLHSFAGVGAASWNAVFLMRVHELSVAEAAYRLALLSASFSALGIGLSGFVADRLGRRDVRWYQWLPGGATLLQLPFSLLFYLWPDPAAALLFLAPSAFFAGWWAATGHAMAQGLARPQMRAMASAFMLLVQNLVGLGLGPWTVGLLNDALEPAFGARAVRASLVLVALTSLWGSTHNFLCARSLREDLRAKERG